MERRKRTSESPDLGNGYLCFYKDSDQHPSPGNGPPHAFVEVGRLQPAGLQYGVKFEAARTPAQWFPG